MADESYSTKLAEGVYVRANDVLIHLNTANEDPGNGINLAPPVPVPEPPTGGGRVYFRSHTPRFAASASGSTPRRTDRVAAAGGVALR